MLSNKEIVYIGIILAAISLIGFFISITIYKVKKMQLEMQLKDEYGILKKESEK